MVKNNYVNEKGETDCLGIMLYLQDNEKENKYMEDG